MISYYLKPFFSLTKKIFIVVFTFSIILILFSYFWKSDSPKHVAHDPTKENRKQLYELINHKELNKTVDGRVYITAVRSLMCSVIGEGCTDNPSDGDKNIRNSLLGTVSNIVVMPLERPPASGVQWAYEGFQKAGFVPNTYADMGIGYAALSPFKQLWTMFRNLVFLLMVLMIVAIGFMIMFRTKINAQTVISLENSLPKIVLTLIYISFSFAIAGFMIDMMYVSMYFIAGIFVQPDLEDNILQSTNKIMDQALFGKSGGPFGFIFDGGSVAQVASGFYQFIPGQMRVILDQIVGIFGTKLVFEASSKLSGVTLGGAVPGAAHVVGATVTQDAIQSVGKFVQGLFGKTGEFIKFVTGTKTSGTPVIGFVAAMLLLVGEGVIAGALGPIVTSLFIFIVLMSSLLLVFLRIIIMLISAYVQILVQVIFAPVFIAFEVIPGQSGFTNWLKTIFLNLLTFPLLLLVLLVSKTIIAAPMTETPLWQPPFIWGFNPQSFQFLIGGAFLFMAPDLIKMFKEMTGIKAQGMNLNMGSFFSSASLLGSATLGSAGRFHALGSLVNAVPLKKDEKGNYTGRMAPIAARLNENPLWKYLTHQSLRGH